jgi:hypothetical protein
MPTLQIVSKVLRKYADDIVLLSESKSGLQSSLNILGIYCSNWKLQVNVEKSKVLIFNSNGKTHVNEFSYNNNIIQTVSDSTF